MRLCFALLFASLSTVLSAQGSMPPFQLGLVPLVPGLNAGSVPGTTVVHIHMVHLPGDPPNVFYCALGVGNLAAAYGGAASGLDLLCGSYDILTDTFTPNLEAAALNTTSHEYNMVLHHSGLFATFDNHRGGMYSPPFLVSRAAVGQPWQMVGSLGWPLPCCGANFDSALADYQGQTQLLYVSSAGIMMTPIDLSTGQLSGPPILIVSPNLPMSYPNSPIPVTDPNGELIGVFHGVVTGQVVECDHYMSLDLDPNTPPVLLNDTTTFTAPGGFVGGRLFGVDQLPFVGIFSMDTIWVTGGRAPVGGVMHVRMFSPPTSGPQVYSSLLAVNTAFSAVGMQIPPVQGLLGINAFGTWVSALLPHNNLNGEALISFAIPNSPSLSGVRLAAQSVTLEVTSSSVYFGNTAMLVVE